MGEGLLVGKRVLVTGASHGIGAAIAVRCAVEGASVVLVARHADQLQQVATDCKESGGKAAEVMEADLTSDAGVDTVRQSTLKLKPKEALQRNGGIDVLVNAAGMIGRAKEDVVQGEVAEWDKIVYLDMLAVMRLTHHLCRPMVEKNAGIIINIGSKLGLERIPAVPVYSAAKHGLRGWSHNCHEALRQKGIKVTLINPGWVDTPMNEDLQDVDHSKMIKPDDVAEAAMLPFKTSVNCVPWEINLTPTIEPLNGI